MYAVIEAGGKQYRVELGSELAIDRLDVTAGETIELGRVLLVADGDSASVGRPVVEGARVSADVVRQDRGEKLVVFKYRPKARRRVKHGHRQELTVVRVADIEFDGRSAAQEARQQAQQRQQEQAAAAEAAERQAAADRALADKLAREQSEAEAAQPETGTSRSRGRSARPAAEKRAATETKPAAEKPGSEKKASEKPASEKKASAPSKTTTRPKAPRTTKKDEYARWHTRKPAPAPRTGATASASGWA